MTLLHTDIPTIEQVDQLMAERNPASVTIYLPTDTTSTGEHERLELKNLITEAVAGLHAQGVDKRVVAEVEDELLDLVDDVEIWPYMARSLAIFATPEGVQTFRLPNHLNAHVQVADRFFVKPLMRSITFPHLGYVIALSQNETRLLEVLPEGASYRVDVDGLPSSMDHALASMGTGGRAPRGRISGAEGAKVRMVQYSRKINQALRSVLDGESPLIIAGTEPLVSIFRASSTYPYLTEQAITGNPETTSDADLTTEARAILDDTYAAEVQEQLGLFQQRRSSNRATSQLSEVAIAATMGMVDTVFVDIDDNVMGRMDPDSGAVEFSDDNDPEAYGLVDEIVRRVWRTGGSVVAVRRDEVPDGETVAAILRYPLG
jgi:hypothetical protein